MGPRVLLLSLPWSLLLLAALHGPGAADAHATQVWDTVNHILWPSHVRGHVEAQDNPAAAPSLAGVGRHPNAGLLPRPAGSAQAGPALPPGASPPLNLEPGWGLHPGEKFMWFAAHGGFGNQVVGLKWALCFAGYLNRTLIIPPKLPHRSAVPSIGRCKWGPTRQSRIRHAAWEVYSQHLRARGYVSMGDIVDLGSLPPSLVPTIDLRHFVVLFCGCDVRPSCSGPLCLRLHDIGRVKPQSNKDAGDCLVACGDRIGARERQGSPWVASGELALSDYNCGDTLFTVKPFKSLQDVMSALGPGQTHLYHSHAYEAFSKGQAEPRPVQLVQAFGPGSKAWGAKVLAFGSCFHPRIVDLQSSEEERNRQLFNVMLTIPFTPPIMALARSFVYKEIRGRFACMHIRGRDGFFQQLLTLTLQHAEANLGKVLQRFSESKAKGQVLRADPLPLFLMTDLEWRQFEKSFVMRLPSKGVQLSNSTHLAPMTARLSKALKMAELGLFANRVKHQVSEALCEVGSRGKGDACMQEDGLHKWMARMEGIHREMESPPEPLEDKDVTLFVEQAVCCHHDAGFVHEARSTVASMVSLLKQGGHCSLDDKCL